MQMSRIGFLGCVLAVSHAPLVAAMDVDQVPSGTPVMLLTEIALPAHEESVTLYERDIEQGDQVPRTLACQVRFQQAGHPRQLEMGDVYAVHSTGWIKQTLIPGQHGTRTAFVRLSGVDGSDSGYTLYLRDSGDPEGQTDFNAALWMKRCRIRFDL